MRQNIIVGFQITKHGPESLEHLCFKKTEAQDKGG